MTRIVFRELPGVAAIENQLALHAHGRLLDDEIEELPYLIDEVSLGLFGITRQDTFYWALPPAVRAQYGRQEWEEQFDVLGHYTRDPNEHWRVFDLDLRCSEGGRLHCFEIFGRQLVCALHGLHHKAVPAFSHRRKSKAA